MRPPRFAPWRLLSTTPTSNLELPCARLPHAPASACRTALRSELDTLRSCVSGGGAPELSAALQQAERRMQAAADDVAAAEKQRRRAGAAAGAAIESLQAAAARRDELQVTRASDSAALAEISRSLLELQGRHVAAQAEAEGARRQLCTAEARLRAWDEQRKEEQALRRGESALSKAVRHLCTESKKGAPLMPAVLYGHACGSNDWGSPRGHRERLGLSFQRRSRKFVSLSDDQPAVQVIYQGESMAASAIASASRTPRWPLSSPWPPAASAASAARSS